MPIPTWISTTPTSELLNAELPTSHVDTYSEEGVPTTIVTPLADYISLHRNNATIGGGTGVGSGVLAGQVQLIRSEVHSIILLDAFELEIELPYVAEHCPTNTIAEAEPPPYRPAVRDDE